MVPVLYYITLFVLSGGKADPLPVAPGIITNGYTGLLSGNGPTDLPGAVVRSDCLYIQQAALCCH
jgi:hypothetical protein